MIREDYVSAIIQLKNNMIGRITHAELQINDTIQLQLNEFLESLVLQMFAQFHGEPGRSHVLGPLETCRVKPIARLEEEHSFCIFVGKPDKIRTVVDVVNLVDA